MAILLINPDFGTVRQTLSPGSRILKMIEPDNSRQIFPAHAKKHYLDAVETIANILKTEAFSKDECSDWYDFQENCHPSILEIRQQWEKFSPEEYGDPFGIITFWADKRQAEWDANQDYPAMFPKSTDQSLGYSLMMNNIRRGS